MKMTSARGMLATLTLGLAFAVSGCGSDGNDDSARVSGLETDLEAAERALSDLQAEVAANAQYNGLSFSNRVSAFDHEEMRAADGSTLTIGFSDAQVDGPDIVLDLAAGDPPPQLGDWQGERFESGSDSAKTVAVLYRTPLGAESFLQYGWWQTEMTSSSGRRWFDRHGQLVSARDEIAGVQDIAELRGQATFEGHAAGIYAISNPAEGQNDSGEFTADAMLAVDFDDGSATGTIDNFLAAGERKGWTVSLLRQGFLRGGFRSDPDGDAEVQWTISADQTAPGDSTGNWWSGYLVEDRTDGTLGAVGGFGAAYTNIGRMNGTYGVKKQ